MYLCLNYKSDLILQIEMAYGTVMLHLGQMAALVLLLELELFGSEPISQFSINTRILQVMLLLTRRLQEILLLQLHYHQSPMTQVLQTVIKAEMEG